MTIPSQSNPVDDIRKLVAEGRFQEAVDECRALLFDDPQHPEVLALLREASAAMESESPPVATSSARDETGAEKSGEEEGAETRDSLARRLEEEFGVEEAAPDEEPARQLGDEDQERVDALVREGQERMAEGKYQEAIDVWSRIYIIDINHKKAQGFIEKARVALEEEQRKWDEWIQEGNDLIERGRYDEAVVKFREVLEASPNHSEALDGIERVEQARRESADKEGKGKAMMVKAAKLYRDGQISEAIYTWEKVLEMEPGNERARTFLAEARLKLGEPVVGADQYGAAMAPPPRQKTAAAAPAAPRLISEAAYSRSDDTAPPVVVARGRLPMFMGIAAAAAVIVTAAVYIGLTHGGSDIDDDEGEIATVGETNAPASGAPVEDIVPPSLDAGTFAQLDKQIEKNSTYAQAKKAFAEGRYEEAASLYKTLSAELQGNALVTQQLHHSLYNAGVAALRAANVPHAIEQWQAALQMEPNDSAAQRNVEAARRYLQSKPDDRLRWYAQLTPLRR